MVAVSGLELFSGFNLATMVVGLTIPIHHHMSSIHHFSLPLFVILTVFWVSG
jgi:hypothetical protein